MDVEDSQLLFLSHEKIRIVNNVTNEMDNSLFILSLNLNHFKIVIECFVVTLNMIYSRF